MADKVRAKPRSKDEMLAILSEIGVNGASTKAVAEKHGLSEAALYNWKSRFKGGKKAKRRAKKKVSAKGRAAARASMREIPPAPHFNGKRPSELDAFTAQLSSYVTSIVINVVRQELPRAILSLAHKGAST